tara:strand:+ start:20 stop:241 length:222 start_codon:yes stop_codon:yes gene_type:complete
MQKTVDMRNNDISKLNFLLIKKSKTTGTPVKQVKGINNIRSFFMMNLLRYCKYRMKEVNITQRATNKLYNVLS